MPTAEPMTRVETRLDTASAADLKALAAYYRVSPSAVVRMAIAALARRELPERPSEPRHE